MAVTGILLFASCQKPDKVQKFDDVFDVSGIKDLNQKIDNSTSLSGLAAIVEGSDLNVPGSISASKLEQMYTFLEQNIRLSDSEIDKLLQNDVNTLQQVLTRFGNLPAEFGDKNMNFDDLGKSAFSRYLLVQKEEPGINFYPEDYYSAIQAYRGYIENCIIKPMKKIHTVVLHNQNQLPHGAHFEYYVLIAMNNNWAMWWSYWRYGNIIFKIKHKGGSGSFPG
jgi:hypothetical protein